MDNLEKAVPPGALPEEVADDVPLMASEGEYVIPANVVRFIGLDKIEKMISSANEALAQMEEDGRIGGEPVDEEDDDELPFPEEELVGYAEGGLVAENTFDQDEGFTGVKEYKNADGQIMYVSYFQGEPLIPIPPSYVPNDQAAAPASGEAPDPMQRVSTGGTNNVPRSEYEKGANKVSPLAGDPEDWSVDDFVDYGKQMNDPGSKAIKQMIKMMPGGKFMLAGREKMLSTKSARLLDEMLESGTDLKGQPLTPELTKDLSEVRTQLAEKMSKASGIPMNPLGKAADLVGDFLGWAGNKLAGKANAAPTPPTPSGSASTDYRSSYNESPWASRSTLDSQGRIATQSAPPPRPTSNPPSRNQSSGRSEQAEDMSRDLSPSHDASRPMSRPSNFSGGGLITRPNKGK